jgi:hypothetical protein
VESIRISHSPLGSYFLRPGGESGSNRSGEAVPAIRFFSQTLSPTGCEFVKLGAPIVVGFSPLGF